MTLHGGLGAQAGVGGAGVRLTVPKHQLPPACPHQGPHFLPLLHLCSHFCAQPLRGTLPFFLHDFGELPLPRSACPIPDNFYIFSKWKQLLSRGKIYITLKLPFNLFEAHSCVARSTSHCLQPSPPRSPSHTETGSWSSSSPLPPARGTHSVLMNLTVRYAYTWSPTARFLH